MRPDILLYRPSPDDNNGQVDYYLGVERQGVSMNKKSIIIYCALAILLAVSFIISLWPLQMSHWWDEAVYLQHSEIIFSGVDNYNEFELRPPVLPMLFAAGYIIKHHMFTASVITSLLGTLGVLFTFLVGKKLYNEEIGLLSALFLGLSPFTATASHWIMTDMPSLSFIIISFYLAVLAVKRNSKWFVLVTLT